VNLALLVIGQLIFYLGILLLDTYIGTLIAVGVMAICASIWILARLSELIEPSRVSRTFFRYMFSGWVAPLTALGLFYLLRAAGG
jgi:hypothetical protein